MASVLILFVCDPCRANTANCDYRNFPRQMRLPAIEEISEHLSSSVLVTSLFYTKPDSYHIYISLISTLAELASQPNGCRSYPSIAGGHLLPSGYRSVQINDAMRHSQVLP